MANVVIYTKHECPFSRECKKFFDDKNVKYTEFVIDNNPALTIEMQTKSDRSDTPQVFINGSHIGSFDDIKALEATEKLDAMLDL